MSTQSLPIRTRESQAFLQFAMNHFSPATSSTLAADLQKRCRICLLNESASTLLDGLCAPCREQKSQFTPEIDEDQRREMCRELDELIMAAAGTGTEGYDALLMYSGGKDSAYLLDELRRRFPGLRLLALMVESGFASEVALENIRYTFTRVDVSNAVVTPHVSLFSDLFRHCLVNFERRGGYETIDRADGDLLFDVGKNFAARLGIPLVIAGLSRAQCEDILMLDSYEIPRARLEEKRVDIAGFSLTDIYAAPDYRYWWDGTNPPRNLIPRVIFPFFAWDYDEQRVRDTVAERGLLPQTQVDPIVTNHKLIPVILALDYLRLGYCTFEPEFSKMVRRGAATRATWLPVFQALEYLVPRGEFMPESLTGALLQLGLTPHDLSMPISGNDLADEKRVGNW